MVVFVVPRFWVRVNGEMVEIEPVIPVEGDIIG